MAFEHASDRELSIHQLLKQRVEEAAGAVAIDSPGRQSLTYRGLLEQVDYVAQWLGASGITRNDRVAIMVPNGAEMAVAFLGISAVATCAPLNPGYRESEIDFYLLDLNAKALIVQAGVDSAAISVAQRQNIPIIELSPASAAGTFSLSGLQQKADDLPRITQATDIALMLHTSGTTARPKRVPLTHANLLTSARNIAETLQLTVGDRCLNVMPLFHIHGIVGALLSSLWAGSSVVCTGGFDEEQFLTWLETYRASWYTAVPAIHQAVLSCIKGSGKPLIHSLRLIRSSSSPLPVRLMRELEESFQVPVIEAFGMTEGAHQISSNPLPPGRRKEGSVGPAAGVEVSIMDSDGKVLSSGEGGEIVIRGSSVMSGYMNSPESNEESFTRGWFRTGDQGYLDDEGYLFITGRLKEIVNRGGEKISPGEVEDILMDHPAIAEAVVFSVKHKTLGEDVAAAVVLKEKCSVTESELQRFAALSLTDFKIPRRVKVVDQIPKGATGKVQRSRLAEQLGLVSVVEATHTAPDFVPPRTETEAKLAEIWKEVLGIERLAVGDNFSDLGGDSLTATRILNRVCSNLQVELTLLSFFEAPTIAEQAARVEEILSNDVTRSSKVRKADHIPDAITRETIPLSATQQRLWFFQQLNPESIVTARPVALLLTGPLDKPALERSLSEIVRRHGILRTIYQEQNGEPFQVVLPPQPIHLEVKDLQHLPETEWEAETKRIAVMEARKIIDLSERTPLLALLLKLDQRKHTFLIIMHHIAVDGWSEALLLKELSILYEAFVDGKPSPLPELPIQYTDFAVQQQRRFTQDTLDQQIIYWKKQLEGMVPTLSLPITSPGSNASVFKRSQQSFVLRAHLVDQLEAFSRREKVTPFMTLLAAFQLLLSRYSQQEDIAVGTVIAGRMQTEVEGLIGCFGNLLVLRTDLSARPTFRELVQRVRRMALEAYEHQEMPFERLIEALEPERRLNQTPLFQVLFELRNMPRVQTMDARGLHIENLPFDFNLGTWALIVEISKVKDSFHCIFEFACELFHPDTIERMAGHYQTLLQSIVANPDEPITALSILTERERHQFLPTPNDTRTNYRQNICIHQLFEEQVGKTPDNVAVKLEEEQLTYRELNERANQLAHYLKNYSVGPEVLVAVYIERSLEMVVALLGILKAGGAYVPLDRVYPRERLAFMLADAKPVVVLTKRQLAEELPEHIEHKVCLDTEWSKISRESKQNPMDRVTPDNLAYVIYTSGSTGKPKGVLVTHCNVVRLFEATQHWFHFHQNDVWTLFHSYAFDFSVWELWGALLYGGRLLVIPYWMSRSPEAFYELLAKERVTVLNQTPSAFRQLITVEEPVGSARDLALRLVIFGGEALESQSLKPWFDRHGDRFPQLINMYGITETTVHVTYRLLTSADLNATAGSVIGAPIPDLRLYILDRYLQPVPTEVPGEMYIGGLGVTRGYLNQPELTGARFIPNTFSGGLDARLYKSGDRARYLSNGEIEFLGRIDDQVKIRGFRIELGEIESVLRQHPEVREAVVIAREDLSDDKRLVAYIVSEQGESLAISGLRSYLEEWLPDYMVPSVWVMLESLPLTTNGKLDRSSLPEPDARRPKLEQSLQLPRTPAEEQVASIWRELLRTDQVGVYDNFFELGGHSLLLTQLASRILDTFRVRLPLRLLFDLSTIEEMTVAILKRQIEHTDKAKIDEMLAKVTELSTDEVLRLLKTR